MKPKRERTRVLVADDHRVIVSGIKSTLQDHPEFEVVGEAYDGRQAVELIQSLKPEIVIMDISMPELNGLDATLEIKKFYPEAKIIIFTMYCNSRVKKLFSAGISGYVMKDEPLSNLILALESVKAGGTYFSKTAQAVIQTQMEKSAETEKDPFEKLSMRERQVFQLLAEGTPVKRIAEKLDISPKTVESHKYNIMEKLNVNSVAGLTKIAFKKNLIKL
ncbi:MAG: response regulator transcription factor [Deltaproteobacteria bacterium]